MADFVIGINCKLYRNSGTFGSPTWTEMPEVQDLRLVINIGEADVTTRGGNGWEQIAAVLKSASIEFGLLNVPTSANVAALVNAAIGLTPIELLCLDGAYNVAGSKGLRASCGLFNVTRTEELRTATRFEMAAKPTYSVNAPTWFVAT